MEKIKNVAQHLGIITVEDMERYTALELIMMIVNKMKECQELVNDHSEKIQYLLDEGLLSEVAQIFDEWLQDGTFDTLINQSALKEVNKRIDETNAQLSQTMSVCGELSNSKKSLQHMLLGLDSLTNGAGGSSYVDYFRDKVHASYGYGGGGYLPFEYQTLVNEPEYFTMGISGGWSYISALDTTTDAVRYSFDNKGLHGSNLSDASITLQIKTNTKYIKLIYLQQPNGGAFNYKFSRESSPKTVETNGPLKIVSIDLINSADYSGNINITGCNGLITIYGVYTYNDRGIVVSRFGQGGQTLAKICDKANGVIESWLDILQPSLLILNAGTNDGGGAAFKTNLLKYTEYYIQENCDIILVRPHEQANGWNPEPYLFDVAKEKNINVLNLKMLLGSTYQEAVNNGYMLDTVHPNARGNRKIANKILDYLSIQKYAPLPDKSFPLSDLPTEKIYNKSLADVVTSGHSTNAANKQIYSLGLTAGNSGTHTFGTIELDIVAQVNDTFGYNISSKKIIFPIYNFTNDSNKATTDTSKMKTIDVYDMNESLNAGYSIVIANESDKVNVYIKTTYATGWVCYNVKTKYIGQKQHNNGYGIIENTI